MVKAGEFLAIFPNCSLAVFDSGGFKVLVPQIFPVRTPKTLLKLGYIRYYLRVVESQPQRLTPALNEANHPACHRIPQVFLRYCSALTQL
jgi:hypothetical protein